jgi:hypothetical protein
MLFPVMLGRHKMEFEELKKKYKILKKKYGLPGFDEILLDFDIGKLDQESGNLLRDLRGITMEKIVHYVRLLELMVNPSQTTPVFMIFLKEITPADKEVMNRVFKNFVGLELESFKLDVESNEKKEAEYLKNLFKVWLKTREDLKKLVALMERNWNTNQKSKDSKNYFG